MLTVAGISAENMAINLLPAVRIAHTAGSLLIEHAISTAELAHLEYAQDSVRLKYFVLGMQLLIVMAGLTLLYKELLIVAIAWDTPY